MLWEISILFIILGSMLVIKLFLEFCLALTFSVPGYFVTNLRFWLKSCSKNVIILAKKIKIDFLSQVWLLGHEL